MSGLASVVEVARQSNKAEQTRTEVRVAKQVIVMKKPVASVAVAGVVREATTGRAVLSRVWAVGERESASQPDAAGPGVATEMPLRPRPELAFYRKYTEAMLRRYLRMSMATGRVPSLLGRELFRAKVTSYRVASFEDVVIFCFDVERCLQKLQKEEQDLIKRIALQEYTQGEAASLLGLSLRDTVRKYGAALDRLTGILLAAKMMEPLAHIGR
jgi:hypothetical protein